MTSWLWSRKGGRKLFYVADIHLQPQGVGFLATDLKDLWERMALGPSSAIFNNNGWAVRHQWCWTGVYLHTLCWHRPGTKRGVCWPLWSFCLTNNRDTLQWIHELGCLCGQAGKFKTIHLKQKKSVAKATSGCYTTLKTLCPTRWTVHTPAINSVLNQYEGLCERFQKGNTAVGQLLAQDIMIGF